MRVVELGDIWRHAGRVQMLLTCTYGSPAENAALAAIKPTVGLTSRYLVVPISEREYDPCRGWWVDERLTVRTDQDTVGPMARSVKDAAYLLQAIAGRDPRDNYTSAAPAKLPDYAGACKVDSLKGARIGVPRNVIERFSDNTTRELILLVAPYLEQS